MAILYIIVCFNYVRNTKTELKICNGEVAIIIKFKCKLTVEADKGIMLFKNLGGFYDFSRRF